MIIKSPPTRPTNVRLVVVILTSLVAVFLYLDRICLSFTERYVKEDLRLTDRDMAVLLSSFFWAYAIGQVPSGWLSDRFGGRLMMTLFLAGWSLFTGLLGLATALVSLIVLRLACGFSQAGAYPTAGTIIGKWVPFARRGLASGTVSLGGRMGGAIAPILTAYLMVVFSANAPSALTRGDLRDVPLLLARLHGTGAAPVDDLGSQLRSGFDAETLAVLHRARFLHAVDCTSGEGLQRFLGSVEEMLAFQSMDAVFVDPADSVLADALVRALNTASLREDLSYAPDHVTHEAATPEQLARRNRLLLEAAYPESIVKVVGAGWRPVMLAYGLAGIVLAFIFYWYFRNEPRQHTSCNAAEIALIEGPDAPAQGSAAHAEQNRAEPLPLRYMLTNTSLWLMSIVQILTNVSWVFLITWMPRFLAERYQVPVVARGWMSMLPLLLGMAGMFLGGWWTDYMAQRIGRRWGRALPVALTRFGMTGALIACVLLDGPWEVTIALALFSFICDLGVPAIWAYVLDVGGKNIGAVLGWGNMWGNFGAAASPLIINAIQESYDWNGVFIFCGAIMVLAGVLALFVDSTKPIVPAKPGTA